MMNTSVYPDGTRRNFEVVVRPNPAYTISTNQIRRILCHRLDPVKLQEQYLVEWRVRAPFRAFSWHNVDELLHCLPRVQKYLNVLQEQRMSRQVAELVLPLDSHLRKRKSPYSDGQNSPISISSNGSSSTPALDQDPEMAVALYGRIVRSNGRVTMEVRDLVDILPRSDMLTSFKPDTTSRPQDYVPIPTQKMKTHALQSHTSTRLAEHEILKRFRKNLATLHGPQDAPVTIAPCYMGTPSLEFIFINENVLGKGVTAAPSDVIVGCGSYSEGSMTCRPNMGQKVGCEYSRICECLELAPVDEGRLTEGQSEMHKEAVRLNLAKMGLPKKFPYSGKNTQRPECLISFYLEKRNEIYECNPRCACGPACKTRNVQHGRKVPLQIFHTGDRGWGLRCPVPLHRGQFIDTYRGEIITDAEAEIREERGQGKSKNSYLFSLDKFQVEDELEQEEIYVVDGEFQGGPTRFINHSCEPNCGQYVVSFNKYDRKIYELAFFATEDIPTNEELTFDYLDSSDIMTDLLEGKTEVERREGTRCCCGAENCRGWLWV